MNIFQQKLNKLPKEVASFLVSMEAVKLNKEVCGKYGLKGDQVDKYVNLVSSLFFKEVSLDELVKTVSSLFGFDNFKANEMSKDIAGIRLLVVKDWVAGVKEYIESLNGKIEDYAPYVERQKKALEDEDKFFKEAMAEESLDDQKDSDKEKDSAVNRSVVEFDITKEKNDSVNNFKESVLELLDSDNEPLADEYNGILLQVLIDGGVSAKVDLEKALYENQERLTSAPFMLDGKVSSGTVANWIKYFISIKGTGIFDNIVLSSFLVQSPNAKALSEVEKSRLRKLLLLYRNLKFFPESMPNNTGEGWEIIPTQVTEEVQREVKVVQEKKDSENEKKIQELRATLAKYPEGSLARRAVEEEIKRVKSQK